MYFVFRRNDGYVGAIVASTSPIGRQRLEGWPLPGGRRVEFEILLETNDWDEAHARLVAERAEEVQTS